MKLPPAGILLRTLPFAALSMTHGAETFNETCLTPLKIPTRSSGDHVPASVRLINKTISSNGKKIFFNMSILLWHKNFATNQIITLNVFALVNRAEVFIGGHKFKEEWLLARQDYVREVVAV